MDNKNINWGKLNEKCWDIIFRKPITNYLSNRIYGKPEFSHKEFWQPTNDK
jgi:hypothetical protein